MKKIYSKDGELLHAIVKKSDFAENRIDVSPENEFLQLAMLKFDSGRKFKPHKHIFHEKTTNIAQESWIVVEGQVKAHLYDLNDEVAECVLLDPGDVSITFRGGHTYEIMKDNTLVYEYKTGPYLGQEFDKVFLDD